MPHVGTRVVLDNPAVGEIGPLGYGAVARVGSSIQPGYTLNVETVPMKGDATRRDYWVIVSNVVDNSD
jgi:hypothetical protein